MKEELILLPALSDNYIYLLDWDHNALVIDPADADEVIQACSKRDLNLSHILITHHHFDHTGGNEKLKEKYGSKILGPDDARIPGLDQVVDENIPLSIGPFSFRILFVPGHTATHIAYYEENLEWLFCGDTLFTGGCGKLFEGTPEQMLQSLQTLASLPKSTKVWCGHEYTVKNMEFAHFLEPDTPAITERLKQVKEARQKGQPTVGTPLSLELETNPFLRYHNPSLHKALQLETGSDLDVFTKTRELKDRF